MNKRLWMMSTMILGSVAAAWGADWPQWGGGPSKNMVSSETGLPVDCEAGKLDENTGKLDLSSARNIKWAARLGNQTYGNTTVALGKVFIGTNNDPPRDDRFRAKGEGDKPGDPIDMACVLCFDEKDGKFLWQLAVPKLSAGKNVDWEQLGICSSPAVDVVDKRVYVVTNRCEVVCLDADGLANGNDGPFKDEGQAMAGPGAAPLAVKPTDADIIWSYDMRDELGILPHYQTASSILLVGERIYVTTSNSRDWANHVPSPDAPALICLDKKTGKLLGQEMSGISRRTYHSNWSSPAYGKAGDQEMVIFGAGDGWCYGFDPNPVPGPDGVGMLKELWRFNANPKEQLERNGKPTKYGASDGPNEIVATPVMHEGKVYVATGQNPENGDGSGCLSCIDATKRGDITQSGEIWRFKKITRSLSTPSIVGDLLFVGDYAGYVYCLELKNGNMLWKHDVEGRIWGSTLAADGKLYIGSETGSTLTLAAGREKKVLGTSNFDGPIFSSAVAANGVLYVATEKFLYAIAEKR